MTVSQKRFKILSGHDVANGRTDGRHTIIRPKFHFGRIKTEVSLLIWALTLIIITGVYFDSDRCLFESYCNAKL